MEQKYNAWSFYAILLCIGISCYSFYSYLENEWLFAPPTYILAIVSLLAFVFAIKGLKDKRTWLVRIRSWIAIVLSALTTFILSAAFLLYLTFSSLGANEHLKTAISPDGDYTIDFYR